MSLRVRLIAVFVIATLLPVGLTLWAALRFLDHSLDLAPLGELETVTASLETTGRALYQQATHHLRESVEAGRIQPRAATSEELRTFLDRGVDQGFETSGEEGRRLDYYVRDGDEVRVYSRELPVPLTSLQKQIGEARSALEAPQVRDLRGAFNRALIAVWAALWVVALIGLVFVAARITRPVKQLTTGLAKVAAGDLSTRVPAGGADELGAALNGFNHMTAQLEQSRNHLIQVTRLASWQALAKKMAHEVKNSLTPIRLTMEEIVSRKDSTDSAFLEQAAQIVAEEINTLERRVRAFRDFASEPPVVPLEIDLNALIEERIAFLKAAHPDVNYEVALAPGLPHAMCDPDLMKGVLTNLLENAAEAASAGGRVRTKTAIEDGRLIVDVLDSGPGLSPQVRASLFQPTISFKKGGMGLGLSIAHRAAVLCGGDIQTFDGELGGAGFRLVVPKAT